MSSEAAGGGAWEELRLAERFRHEGREGRARVCARRAAGWAVRRHYRRQGNGAAPGSVVALLRWFSRLEGPPAELRAAAERLTVAVTVEHALPHPQDPLDDARALVAALAGDADPADG